MSIRRITVGRCVGASCCCVVQYVRVYGVRYFSSDAACAGSVAGLDALDTAVDGSIALQCVVSNIPRVLGI